MRRHHRPSTIDKLDPKVREEINRLRIDSGFTLDQIIEHLKAMDVSVSRSALGRHLKPLEDAVGDRIKELRVAAEAVRKTLNEADDSKVGALNRELAHSILMRTSTATDDDGVDVTFSPQEAMFIAKALDHLAKAEKTDTDRVLRIRQETAKAASKVVEEVLKKSAPGLSAETIADIRKRVLGVAG